MGFFQDMMKLLKSIDFANFSATSNKITINHIFLDNLFDKIIMDLFE